MTPSAAARPKALPPVKSTAWHFRTRFARPRTSVSRVPGAPPRASTAAAMLVSQRMAVQPVALRRSVWWPTRMPGTSVMALRGPGCQPLISGRAARTAAGAEIGHEEAARDAANVGGDVGEGGGVAFRAAEAGGGRLSRGVDAGKPA